MNADIAQNISNSFPQDEDSFGQKAQDLALKVNKAINLAKKARTIYFLVTSTPLLAIALVMLIIGFVVFKLVDKPSLDTFDLAFQCQIVGQPLDQNCLNKLYEKVQKQTAPTTDEKGGINNPSETFPQT